MKKEKEGKKEGKNEKKKGWGGVIDLGAKEGYAIS